MSARADQARAILAQALGIAPSDLPDDATARMEAWDSMTQLRIATALEQVRGDRLTFEQILSIRTVADIAALLGG